MRAYVLSVLGGALFVGALEMLAPATLRGVMRTVGALVVLSILLAPLGTALPDVDEWWELLESLSPTEAERAPYEEILREGVMAAGEENIRAGLLQLLEEEFGIAAEDCRVVTVCEGDGESIRVRRVSVVLYGRAVFCDPHAIEAYVASLLGCECLVSIGG